MKNPVSDDKEVRDEEEVVLRGQSWYNQQFVLKLKRRTYGRAWDNEDGEEAVIGFRVGRTKKNEKSNK